MDSTSENTIKYKEINRESITTLVYSFYQEIKKEPSLAPFFTRAIGTTAEQWEPHLQKMVRFWSSVMLKEGSFKGNPLQTHREIPGLTREHFASWLSLFEQTVYTLFTEEHAELFVKKSQHIARTLQKHIFDPPESGRLAVFIDS